MGALTKSLGSDDVLRGVKAGCCCSRLLHPRWPCAMPPCRAGPGWAGLASAQSAISLTTPETNRSIGWLTQCW